MRKVIFSMNTTIDGFFEGPQKELDWTIVDDEMHDYYADLLKNAGIILFGRVTYELMVNYWPNASNDPSATKGMIRFADAINPLPKIVYSNTLEHVGWNTTIRRTVIPDEIRKMKDETGGYIFVDGATLARAFINYGLVDEIQLMVHPVAIGAGTPLFKGIDGGIKLNFLRSHTLHSGEVVLCYQPDGKLQ